MPQLHADFNLDIALRRIGEKLRGEVIGYFEGEHDPYGSPWAPLSPSTLARRKKKGRGAKILRDTGTLFGSIGYKTGKNSVLVGFGQAAPYGVFHLYGTKRVPARPFLPVNGLPQSWVKTIKSELPKSFTFKFSEQTKLINVRL